MIETILQPLIDIKDGFLAVVTNQIILTLVGSIMIASLLLVVFFIFSRQ